MAINVNINNTAYTIPNTGEEGWGDNVTNWIVAASSFLLQRSGGSFPLSAEVDFGATAGLRALIYRSKASDVAASGVLRLGHADKISFRNQANSADLQLGVNALDQLTLGAFVFPISGQIVNADISPSAAIAYSKLALTNSILNADIAAAAAIVRSKLASGSPDHVLVNDASGVMSSEASLSPVRGGTGLTSLTTGDLLYASATNVLSKLPAGAPGQVLTQGASVPAWQSPGTGAVQTKTANYTALATDSVIMCDATSASFTITLYAPTSQGRLTVSKTDADFTKIVTVSLGGFSTELHTQGESVDLVANGTAWAITGRRIPSTWAAYTPITTGIGTPTIGFCQYQRRGPNLAVKGRITSGTVDASDLSVAVPVGLSIASVGVTATVNGNVGTNNAGWVSGQINPLLESASTTEVKFSANDGSSSFTPLPGNSVLASGDAFSFFFEVPITGWEG